MVGCALADERLLGEGHLLDRVEPPGRSSFSTSTSARRGRYSRRRPAPGRLPTRTSRAPTPGRPGCGDICVMNCRAAAHADGFAALSLRQSPAARPRGTASGPQLAAQAEIGHRRRVREGQRPQGCRTDDPRVGRDRVEPVGQQRLGVLELAGEGRDFHPALQPRFDDQERRPWRAPRPARGSRDRCRLRYRGGRSRSRRQAPARAPRRGIGRRAPPRSVVLS